MRADEKHEFGELLVGLLELYGRQITPAAAGLWWGAFERHPLGEVRAAFSRYTQDPEQGRYPPTPAAVLGCLPSAVSRPGADEAWALALASLDEEASVCTNDEIQEAANAAKAVWDETADKVGARMAFKSVYERVVSERRLEGRTPTWRLSLGWNQGKRAGAVEEAVRRGLISREAAARHLPPPEPEGAAAAVAGLLSGSTTVVPFPGGDEPTRRRLAELREAIASAGRRAEPEGPSRAETIVARKRAALAALEAHQNQHAKEAG
ncbi:hypothetical protein [Marichromatium gracile]|uniref:Replicative helicase inhibitor G39P N-terminal domain-containing protein n=1 Tax=Marichromatium gracile TaxID=1048 RepID=A0ABR5VGF4_MARGR|nr:hypothetical protein [Marichromatium gracile]KXX64197.1 hypothetical protein AY586_14715 [Marichromatium gracile]